jgi:hypothetical protein
MPNTYDWTITDCDYETIDGHVQAVTMVHANVKASDGTNETKARNHTFKLGAPGDSFIAFDSLTTADLMGMVDADEKALAEEGADDALAQQIADEAAAAGKGLPSAITG